jgi:hypothetical protein
MGLMGGVVKIIRKKKKILLLAGEVTGKTLFKDPTIYLLLWFRMDDTSVSVGFYSEP